MKCPMCLYEMEAYFKDISQNSKSGKQYNRTCYFCKHDDVYVVVEIPVKKEENLA